MPFEVQTKTGLDVYSSSDYQSCVDYITQAQEKGSTPGELRIVLQDNPLPTIRELVTVSGLSQAKFAAKYHIPARTVEDWCTTKHNPPDYVRYLLYRLSIHNND